MGSYKIENISVVVNTQKKESKEIFYHIKNLCKEHNINIFLLKDAAKKLNENKAIVSFKRFIEGCDLVIAIGGDGTFINAAHLFLKRDVPILGVYTGRVGFLTEFMPSELDELFESIKFNNLLIEERFMIEAEIKKNKKVIKKDVVGLNEIVVHKGEFPRIIKIQTYIDGEYVGTFEGDGIIVATPTGSTGYSLSNIGPILVSKTDAFVINTISPHTLSIRPIIVPSSSIIELKFEKSSTKKILSSDGIKITEIEPDDVIKIFKSKYTTKLVRTPKKSFFDILREKFEWIK